MSVFLVYVAALPILARSIPEVDLNTLLGQHHIAVVLFYSGASQPQSEFARLVNSLSDDFPNITIGSIDVGSAVFDSPSVPYFPCISIFYRQQYVSTYSGDWTRDALSEFINTIAVSHPPRVLSTPIQISEFQQTEPLNVILFARLNSSFSGPLLKAMGIQKMLTATAVVSNEMLANEVGVAKFPSLQINRPVEGSEMTVQTLTREHFLRELRPTVWPIRHGFIGTSTRRDFTLVGIMNRHNGSHVRILSNLLSVLIRVFENSIGYQTCDFLDCLNFSKSIGISVTTDPLIVLFRNENGHACEILYPGRLLPTDLRLWIRRQMTIAKEIRKAADTIIPTISLLEYSELMSNLSFNTAIFLQDPENDRQFFKELKVLQRIQKIVDRCRDARVFRMNVRPGYRESLGLPTDEAGSMVVSRAGDGEIAVIPKCVSLETTLAGFLGHADIRLDRRAIRRIQKVLPEFKAGSHERQSHPDAGQLHSEPTDESI
jgi:hypothetical protein